MPNPIFVVPIADVERGTQSVAWDIPVSWLEDTLRDTDATPRGTPGHIEVELSKNGREVMVRGHATVDVTMPCVVTLDPLPFALHAEIFLLLEPAAGAPLPRRAGGTGRRRIEKKPAAGAAGAAGTAGPAGSAVPRLAISHRGRSKPVGGAEVWTADPELPTEDAAKDTYDGEKIVLDGFLREFILLELPMYPRRSDLPSDPTPASPPPSKETGEAEAPVDPRLLPLAAIASRLREQKKE